MIISILYRWAKIGFGLRRDNIRIRRQMGLRIKKANSWYEKTRTVRVWVVLIQKTLVVWKFNFSHNIDYQMLLLLILCVNRRIKI